MLDINSNEPVCMILDGKYVFDGYGKIESGLAGRIGELIAGKSASASGVSEAGENAERPSAESEEQALARRGERITVGALVLFGLLDGINPCVFSTLVFFMSLLAVSKVSGRMLLAVGAVYCAACFVCYVLIGFGIFRFITLLSVHKTFQAALEWGMASVLLVFAFLSFRDAWRFRRTGRAASVTLQLPGFLKEKIHALMRRGLRSKYFLPGVFLVGTLVTLLESVCTGQVYLPVLVLLTRLNGGFSKWFFYLLLYNLMFIVPLLLIFAAVYSGLNAKRLVEWSRGEVVISKILLGCLFLILSAMMLILR